jgi:hypothetical protein
VPDYSFGWPSRDHETFVRSAIRSWRDGLINLTGSNRLLNFRPSRTGVISLLRPAPEEVLSRLGRGGTYRFRPLRPKQADPGADDQSGDGEPDEGFTVPPPALGKLDADKSPEDLAAALRSL